VRLVTTMGLLTMCWNFEFPILPIVILAVLNDCLMITISKDRVRPGPIPDKWKKVLLVIFTRAILMGYYLVLSSILLFALVRDTQGFTSIGLKQLKPDQLRGLVYLHISISGSAVIFVTRSIKLSYFERPGALLLTAFCISQCLATIIGIFGFNGYPNDGKTNFSGCGWEYAILIWFWTIFWYIPLDFIKLSTEYWVIRFCATSDLLAFRGQYLPKTGSRT